MMMKRVRRAIGTFVILATCFVTPAQAMESEYRAYEPVVGVHPLSRYVAMARTTPQVVPPEALRNSAGPVYRTGDGAHALSSLMSR